jgi:hypothetical protein
LGILLCKIFGKKPTPIPSEGDGNQAGSPAST